MKSYQKNMDNKRNVRATRHGRVSGGRGGTGGGGGFGRRELEPRKDGMLKGATNRGARRAGVGAPGVVAYE